MAVKNNPFDYPKETWKKFKVYNSSWGFNWGSYDIVEAPNKTWARRIRQGQLAPGCKIIRIEEVVDDGR